MADTPKVGWWATVCCEEDLTQIKTEADLLEMLEWDKDLEDAGVSYTYWPTKEAALSDLRGNDLVAKDRKPKKGTAYPPK